MQDEETDAWTEYDEDDTEDDEDDILEEEEKDIETELEDETEAVEEERKDIEEESEIIDETDILANFMMEFEARRTKELAVKAEEQRKQLRHLIRVT